MRCLIVDDDSTCRKILSTSLAPIYMLDEATNGLDALARVTVLLQQKTPYDLIVIDIMMPVMDGQSALVAIRTAENIHGFPPGKGSKIIMSSALDDALNIKTAFREQVDGYITKPVNLQKMYRLIQDFGHKPKAS